jgi:Zn-finger nucleic acid-binding protein
LGCGLPVERESGARASVCACPPPSSLGRISSLAPISSPPRSFSDRGGPTSGPYRASTSEHACPRCTGRIAEVELHDVSALECNHCLGLFLDKETVDRLTRSEGGELRLAFPRRPREPEIEVHYIPCLVCNQPMNRTIFGKVSGVIVDVCKHHGVWFDAGEINAVIDFVEKGGMERMRHKVADEKAAESRRLADQRRDMRRQPEFDRRGAYSGARLGRQLEIADELRLLFDWW